MASTFDNDLRLEEMATGENAGSWGTKTNTNLELIADAFGYGTFTIADADTTLTMPDGSDTDNALRSLYLKISSSADLTTTRTLTLAPNTVSKLWYIENNTSGGQTITISQGSGANISILNGQAKLVATDGAGAGAAVIDATQDLAIPDLFIDDDLSLQSDGAVINFGADADINLTHAADTSLTLGGAGTTTGLVVNNTATDGDPFMSFALSGTQTFTMGVDDGDSDKFKIGTSAIGTNTRLTITSAGAVGIGEDSPVVPLHLKTSSSGEAVRIESTDGSGAVGPLLSLYRNSASPVPGDNLGQVLFYGEDDGSNITTYAAIESEIYGAADGSESGRLHLKTMFGGALTSRFYMNHGETVVNESGASLDFRVESDNNPNCLFVDASTDRVGINTGTPSTPLDVRYGLGTAYTGTAQSAEHINIFNTSTGVVGLTAGIRHQTRANDQTGQAFFTGAVSSSGGYAPAYVFQQQVGAAVYRELMAFTQSEAVFNNPGNNYDFRVEGDNDTHLFFVDASQDEISMGTSANTAYDAKVAITVDNSSSMTDFEASLLLNDDTEATSLSGGSILFGGQDGTSSRGFAKIAGGKANSTSGDYGGSLMFRTRVNGDATLSENMRIKGDGIVINETAADKDFRVESSGNANMIKVDASQDNVGIGKSPGSGQGTLQTVSSAAAVNYYRPAGRYHIFGESSGNGNVEWIYLGGSYTDTDKSVGYAMQDYNGNFNQYAGSYIRTNQAKVRIGHFIGGANSGQSPSLADNFIFDTAGGAVFNERGQTGDFRVESDTNSNALVVNAGDNTVTMFKGALGDSTVGHDFRANGQTTFVCNNSVRNLNLNNISGVTHAAINFQYSTVVKGSVTVSSTGTTYNTTSDRRLKTDIQPIANGTEKLMAMNPVTHKWIADPDADAVHGFIAQEMQEVFPEAVSGDPDGEEMMSMDYGRITPVLVAALQDAHNKITALEKRLAELEAN